MNDIQIGDKVIVTNEGCEFTSIVIAVIEDNSQSVPIGDDPSKPFIVQDINGDILSVSLNQLQSVE